MKPSRILSRRDLDFLLYEWLDVESLLTRPPFGEHSRLTLDASLGLAEQIAEEHFAPGNAAADRSEPRFEDGHVVLPAETHAALAAFAESGLLGAAMSGDLGGSDLPLTVHRACFAWFQAANAAAAAYPMLTVANANLLAACASAELVARYVPPLLSGRFTGTMCLSEPQAGSSLADIATVAVAGDDGTYRLRGHKMWISGGDHELAENILHLVLARAAGAPPGVKGLSLFLVPKYLVDSDGGLGERNDVVLAGLNHKMGYRGTVNTALNFGDGTFTPGGRAGAVGYLIGAEGSGLAHMFHMMNEARVAVGTGAAALAYTGYLHALEYARERPQGRLLSDKDPQAPPVAIIRHPDVRRMLLAAKCYAEGGLGLALYAARLVDEQRSAPDAETAREAGLLLDVLTPIVKTWPSQWGLVANDLAIQVLGGAGYTRDYPVEQFYRDNRLNPIHEGTTGIQAIDLLGRKVRLLDGAGLDVLADRMRATALTAPAAWSDEAADLHEAVDRLVDVTRLLWSDGDTETALANATIYLEAAGHVVAAWIWLSQATAAHGRSGAFYQGKEAAARFYFRYELPRVGPQFNLLASRPGLLLNLDDDCL